MQEFADNFIPVIPTGEPEDLQHSATHPFCVDPTCYCHEDDELIAPVAEAVTNGLLTPEEATHYISGKLL